MHDHSSNYKSIPEYQKHFVVEQFLWMGKHVWFPPSLYLRENIPKFPMNNEAKTGPFSPFSMDGPKKGKYDLKKSHLTLVFMYCNSPKKGLQWIVFVLEVAALSLAMSTRHSLWISFMKPFFFLQGKSIFNCIGLYGP